MDLSIFTSINQFFAALTNKEFWVRFGIGSLGLGLIIWGLVIIVLSNKEVQSTVKTAGKAALMATPEGAAVTAATSVKG